MSLDKSNVRTPKRKSRARPLSLAKLKERRENAHAKAEAAAMKKLERRA